MAEIQVTRTYTSPLQRARQTAGYISSPELIEVENLRELHQGEWTGKTWNEIETRWPDLTHAKSTDWLGIAAPSGETWPELLRRIAAVWAIVRNGPEPCAIVAHQAVNAAIASLISHTNPLHFAQQYGEVLRLEYAR